MDNILLITGPARSGTTILQYCLNKHPEIILTGESHFAIDIYKLFNRNDYSGKSICFEETKERWYFRMHRIMPQFNLSVEELARKWSNFVYEEFCNGEKYFGDKSPYYCLQWPIMRSIFPNCKIITIERNIEDNARSLVRQEWGANDMNSARQNIKSYQQSINKCEDNIYKITLEGIEANPKKTILGIFDFLDLNDEDYPWDDVIKQVQNPDKKVN